jgi:hypothetical protein
VTGEAQTFQLAKGQNVGDPQTIPESLFIIEMQHVFLIGGRRERDHTVHSGLSCNLHRPVRSFHSSW